MASEYTHARRRPPKLNRQSNVVRASVLETALELGIAQNSTVANWIFNNPLAEESEEVQSDLDNHDNNPESTPDLDENITPTLTYASNTTSDESSSLNSPHNNPSTAVVSGFQVHVHKPSVTQPPHVHFGDFSSEQLQLFSPFALSPPSPTPVLKSHDNATSLTGLSRDTERVWSQDDTLRHNHSHDNPGRGPADAGYSSEGQYLSKGKGAKAKDKPDKKKIKKASKPKALDLSKSDARDTEYTSDGGYLSASSNKSQGKSSSKGKSRAMAFFRRRTKKSQLGSDDEDEDAIPPVPAIPALPKPSSPKPLERRTTPSSPTRSGFTPLTLNFSPPKRRASKSPPRVRVTTSPSPSPRPSDRSASQAPASPLVTSASAPVALTPAATAATFPLPPSTPGTPSSTASLPRTSTPPAQFPPMAPSRPAAVPSSRHHLGIPPPAPPPTLPLPQPPPSPSTPSRMMSLISPVLPSPVRPTTPSRRGIPGRPLPPAPIPIGPALTPGMQQPQALSPRRGSSPYRSLLSPKGPPLDQAVPQIPYGEGYRGSAVLRHHRHSAKSSDPSSEGDPVKGRQIIVGRQQSEPSGLAGFVVTSAYLQRRVPHGVPPSPPHPPPDAPLPQLPPASSTPSARPRTPVNSPSKFHEHFSSVSSVPLSRILSVPPSASPSPSTATRSGSSSGPSVSSSLTSLSASDRSDPQTHEPLGTPDYWRPATSASSTSEVNYGRPTPSSFDSPSRRLVSRFSDRSEASLSVYPPTTRLDSASAYDDDADVEEVDGRKSAFDEEADDASVYTSEDKTAGRRTMYLVESGAVDENGDEIVIAGSQYWHGGHVHPPLPTHPRPGFF
ncbi:hypothetical protein PAXRUDRAFT_835010 [Paxillus rubicundulus Ve08.2h10]|uniref:Uncharacterized protein n=1 Tax=Paxillus rubicundulus Ve08.2h10 TaxID=930991 RepID=A0A0D0C2D5_9AGAM|nr:hypothetical protein PAXRUDRAFT_835010 [Paxillus rubicundulus Ve08.2h10]